MSKKPVVLWKRCWSTEYLVLWILVLACMATAASQESEQSNANVDGLEPVITKKSDVPKKQASVLSRLASWIFPFGEGDSAAAEGQQGLPQYTAPTNREGYNNDDCNPCNKEPWIPVATTYGKNTIIGYMHANDLNQQQFKPPHVNNAYGPPPQFGGGGDLIGAPPPLINSYGPPNNGLYGAPPQGNYGAPLRDNFIVPPQDNYGLPPQEQYGVPPQKNQIAPQDNYGPPPQGNYGVPPLKNQVPPLQDNYGPPPPQGNYGVPPLKNQVPPPQDNYGPPPPQGNYGVPPLKNQVPPPQGNYGVPPQKNQITPPQDSYGAPAQGNYAAPLIPQVQFPPMQHGNAFGSPELSQNFVPPKQNLHFPKYNQPPPPNQPVHLQSKPTYNVPKQNHHRPRHVFYPPLRNQVAPPVQNQFGPPLKLKQIPKSVVSGTPINMKPPPIGNQNYATLPANFDLIPTNNNYPLPVIQPQNTYIPLPPLSPNNHHLPPINNNFNRPLHITNPDYLPPVEQLPLATDHNAPIPFPNLSLRPVAPLHNAQPFIENYPQPQATIQPHNNGNVQIQQSISVADFVASIEHPINLVHSPILEVNVANASTQSDSYGAPLLKPEHNYNGFSEDFRTNTDTNYIPDRKPNFKLSDNPIVVDDAHAAASTFNGSYQERTRVNGSELGTYNNLEGGVLSSDLLNQILAAETVKDQPGSFRNENYDYTSWEPSTSMQPPPKGDSFWLTTFGNPSLQGEVTTKKPKQIQIIIPYTTNNRPSYFESQGRKVPSTSLPMNTQPPNLESVWTDHAEPQEATDTSSTQVINIRDLFKEQTAETNYQHLPFDIIRFQKNIDGWTEQEYAHKMLYNFRDSPTTPKLSPSKKIPEEYLTTLPYGEAGTEATTQYPKNFYDHDAAGSSSKEFKFEDDIETNLITKNATMQTTTQKTSKPNWDKIQIAVSPLTKEKVYVVTPQPLVNESNSNLSTTFSISIMPMKNDTDLNDIRIVLSEWPHLINNLETTTSSTTTTTPRPTSRHPLFGLMDLSSYAPPENLTIHTFSGHSKVINAAVTTSSTRKKPRSLDENPSTTAGTTPKNPT